MVMMRVMNKEIKLVILMLVVALAGMMILAGCSDDDDPVTVVPELDPPTAPETADELITQFQAAYQAMNLDNYVALLDPEFLMILQEDTIDHFPEMGTTLDFTEEERIHQRMFSGESVTDPQGVFVPAMRTIGFLVCNALDGWSAADDQGRFPGTEWAPFRVEILFDRGQEYSTLILDGVVKIYVRTHEEIVDGKETTHCLMAGMVDFTGTGKPVEPIPWGSVKALYR